MVGDRPSNQLASCPFCGSPKTEPQLHHGHGDITFVLCDDCGAVVSFRPNLKGSAAAKAYNKRVTYLDGLPS